MKKAIFHVHTHYSYDCMTAPNDHVLQAQSLGVNYLVIADHDSLAGSLQARHFAKSQNLNIEIPLAAEYLTTAGDLIAIGIPDDFIKIDDPISLCKAVKKVGGYMVLPHPFDGHHLDAIDFSLIDAIEVFNSRSSDLNNKKSNELAERLRKPKVYGADAHFLNDAANALFTFEGKAPLFFNCCPFNLTKTPAWKKSLSQMIKGFKNRDIPLFFRSLKNALIGYLKS